MSPDAPIARTAVFHGPNVPFELTDVAVPALAAGEIRVRTEFVTICRSDVHTYTGRRTEPTPTILGHEIVGRIVEMGPHAPERDARNVLLCLGDRVTWSIYASDPNSALSLAGMPQKGAGLLKYGHERLGAEHTLHGGLSEQCILRPGTVLVKISEQVSLPAAALINCAGATAAGSLRLAGEIAHCHVVISGAGMLGLLACAMSRKAGARRVTAVDTSAERAHLAQRFGATHSLLGGQVASKLIHLDADVVLEFSGQAHAMAESLDMAAIGGTVVWVGATLPGPSVAVNPEQVIRRLLTLKGLHNYNAADLVAAVEFFESNEKTYPIASLVSTVYGLESVQSAFRDASESTAYRVGIAFPHA